MAVDIFANNASATVTSGGSAAPAAGTVEQWTLSSVDGLSASSSATPPTQMRLADPAGDSEIIWLTDLTGTTATVTRGAENTTPVAHAAGFTVRAVVTADVLQRMNTGMRPVRFFPGLWYTGPMFGYSTVSTGSTAANSDNNGQLVPFPVPLRTRFDAVQISVTAASDAAGAVARIGVYQDDGRGMPYSLVRDCGTVDITTTGDKTIDLTGNPLDLQPDLYWRVVIVQNASAGTVNPVFRAASEGIPGFPWPDTARANKHLNGVWITSDAISGALPATLAYGVSVNPPGDNVNGISVWMRAAS